MTDPIPLLQSAGTAAMMAAVYSLLFYVKQRAKKENPEAFDPTKFGATVLVGAGIGVSLALAGVEITQGRVVDSLPMYVGVIAIVESVLKTVWRVLACNVKGIQPPDGENCDDHDH